MVKKTFFFSKKIKLKWSFGLGWNIFVLDVFTFGTPMMMFPPFGTPLKIKLN